jgi:ferritin-like metal-binding protein YciE
MKEKMLDSFEAALNILYNTEKKIHDALPGMIPTISSKELRQIVEIYHKQAENQIEKLNHIFLIIEKYAGENEGQTISGLVKHGKILAEEFKTSTRLDRSVRSLLEKVMLTKICTYTVLHAFAQSIQHTLVCDILERILINEKNIFHKLQNAKIPIVDFEFQYSISSQ